MRMYDSKYYSMYLNIVYQMQAPEIALIQPGYNVMATWYISYTSSCPPACVYWFTGSVFGNPSSSQKNTNLVLEIPPYQRFPRDNSLSKLCALNHRQKELHPSRGRSTGYRCRSNHIEPRSLSCIANKVLFSIRVNSLRESFPKILL